MTNQLQEKFLYLKYEQTPNKHNVYLLRSVVSIAELIYFIFISCTTRSSYFYYRGIVRLPSSSFTLGEWINQEGQEDRRSGGCTTRQTDFTVNQQLRWGLLGVRSVIVSCFIVTLGARQLRWDSPMVGLFNASSSATLGLAS